MEASVGLSSSAASSLLEDFEDFDGEDEVADGFEAEHDDGLLDAGDGGFDAGEGGVGEGEELGGEGLVGGDEGDDFGHFGIWGAGEGHEAESDNGEGGEGIELLEDEFDLAGLDFVGGGIGGELGHGGGIPGSPVGMVTQLNEFELVNQGAGWWLDASFAGHLLGHSTLLLWRHHVSCRSSPMRSINFSMLNGFLTKSSAPAERSSLISS